MQSREGVEKQKTAELVSKYQTLKSDYEAKVCEPMCVYYVYVCTWMYMHVCV